MGMGGALDPATLVGLRSPVDDVNGGGMGGGMGAHAQRAPRGGGIPRVNSQAKLNRSFTRLREQAERQRRGLPPAPLSPGPYGDDGRHPSSRRGGAGRGAGGGRNLALGGAEPTCGERVRECAGSVVGACAGWLGCGGNRYGGRTRIRWDHAKSVLALNMLALVFAASAERVAFKMMVDRVHWDDAHDYRYFLAQLVALLHVPLTFAMVLWRSRGAPEAVTEDVLRFPKRRFACMALLDAVQVFMLLIPAGNVPAQLTVLLLQGSIPVAVLVSAALLRAKYAWRHYAGAGAVLVGIVLNLGPVLWGTASGAARFCGLPRGVCAGNSAAYFLAAVPAALSAVYKERALRGRPMDIFYLNAWVAFFQFLAGIVLCAPAYHLQALGAQPWSAIPQEMGGFLDNVGDGFRCVFSGAPSGHCRGVGFLVAFYVCANVAFNVFVARVIMRGSAVAMYAATTISVPVAYVALAFYGSEESDGAMAAFAPYNFGGLAVVLAGIVCYRWLPEPNPLAEQDGGGAGPAEGGSGPGTPGEPEDALSPTNGY